MQENIRGTSFEIPLVAQLRPDLLKLLVFGCLNSEICNLIQVGVEVHLNKSYANACGGGG